MTEVVQIITPEYIVTTGRRLVRGKPSEVLQLPIFQKDLALLEGHVTPETRAALPEAARMIRRIAPWTTIVFAPRLYTSFQPDGDAYNAGISNGRERFLIEGRCWTKLGGQSPAGTIYISAWGGPDALMQLAAHEAWHQLEGRMSRPYVDFIDSQFEASTYLQGHGYYDTMLERRARAFESWAMRQIEGVKSEFVRGGIDEVFARAWTGETGRLLDDKVDPFEMEAA